MSTVYDHVKAVFGDKLVGSSELFTKSLRKPPQVTMGCKPALWVISVANSFPDIVRVHYEHMLAMELADGTGDGIIDPYHGASRLTYALRAAGWDMHLTRFPSSVAESDIRKFAEDFQLTHCEVVAVCIDLDPVSYAPAGSMVEV